MTHGTVRPVAARHNAGSVEGACSADNAAEGLHESAGHLLPAFGVVDAGCHAVLDVSWTEQH